MNIHINQNPYKLTEVTHLDQLLKRLGYVEKCFATAVNKVFVPRSEYSKTTLKENDHIDIVQPMQGG